MLVVVLFTGLTKAENKESQSLSTNDPAPRLVVQTGHSGKIRSVAFSPDGRLLASTSIEKLIIWDIKSGRELNSIRYGGFTGDNHIAFSPDGKTVASSGLGKVIIWDIASGKPVKELPYSNPDESNLSSLAFSPKGDLVAIAHYSTADDLVIWNIKTQTKQYSMSQQATSVSFNSDGRLLASGGRDNHLRIWELATGTEITSINTQHTKDTLEGISTVAFSPSNPIVATGGWDGLIKLWDINSSTQINIFNGHDYLVTSLAFSSNGNFLASGSWDNTVKLWNVKTGQLIQQFDGHTDHVNSVALSPDDLTIASGSGDKTIRLWNTTKDLSISSLFGKEKDAQPDLFSTLQGRASAINSASLSSDGKYIVSGHDNSAINLWNLETGQRVISYSEHEDAVMSVDFSPSNSNLLASGSRDQTIKFWNTSDEHTVQTFTGHNNEVSSLSFSPSGDELVSGGLDASTKIWQIQSGQMLQSIDEEFSSRVITATAYSPDGSKIAIATEYGTVKLLDAITGAVLLSGRVRDFKIKSITFSPDGSILASSSWDGLINLWDVESGQELRSYKVHTTWGSDSIAFSPDGKTIASGGGDQTIKLVNVITGEEIHTLSGHSDRVNSVIFSKDGDTLFSASADGTIKLWRTNTGELLITLISFDEDSWVVLTPDGRFDTNSLDENNDLHWIMPDAPFKPLPVEIFIREYYQPRLLPRLLAGEKFPSIRSVAELNRVQPKVEIVDVIQDSDQSDNVSVIIEIANTTEEFDRVNGPVVLDSGVYDLRLFRDGQLVAQTPKIESLQPSSSGRNNLRLWRKQHEIKIEGDTRKLVQFDHIRIPGGRNNQNIKFTAYAFNKDRVKSATSSRIFNRVGDSPPRLRKAYLISMGVNAYQNPAWNLQFAANDARKIQQSLFQQLSNLNEYDEIIQIPLISEFESIQNQQKLLYNNATKEKLKSTLLALTGQNSENKTNQNMPIFDKLQTANLEDLIIISFSGHGYVDDQGIFYLLPHDIGPGTDKSITESLLRNSISTDELAFWLRDIDAGNLALLIDACHSAAVVENEEFKPGPMGNSGLGQLAYDKGIRILTASQADDFALEVDLLQHGLLTYSLIQQGIEKNLADHSPTDDSIMLGEWLNFGMNQVPVLHQQIKTGEIRGFSVISAHQPSVKQQKYQQPALFDFTNKSKDIVISHIDDKQ